MAPKSQSKALRPPRDTLPVTVDPRFSVIHNSPRFAPPKRQDTSVALDSRFKPVLSDSKFSSTAPVDRSGRKLPKRIAKAELSRFYRLEEEEEEEEEEGGVRFDPARGEGVVGTSSSESESEDEDGDVEVQMEEDAVAAARAEVPTGEVSKRFACVNLDWDNVRAVDLMKAFASFAPTGGRVTRVTVYPSEFGKQRMEREQLEGPPTEIFRNEKEVDEDENNEEVTEKNVVKEDRGEEFDSTKLRQYQLERLRLVPVLSTNGRRADFGRGIGTTMQWSSAILRLRRSTSMTTATVPSMKPRQISSICALSPMRLLSTTIDHAKSARKTRPNIRPLNSSRM